MQETIIQDDLIEILRKEKFAANEIQRKTKHENWNDNYELYRDKVQINRLTQRQSVNIPLMKETIKTLLSKIDDVPIIKWQERGGDEDKEILFQEMWDSGFKENKLEQMDLIDKKNVLLYGISTKKMNISDSGIDIQVMDVFDIVFDPLMKVGDIESARYIVHQNIFKSLREILANPNYSKKAKDKLKNWAGTEPGVTQSDVNREELRRKMERMEAMGLDSEDFQRFAGGDRLIAITEHFTTLWNPKIKDWERRVVTYANDDTILQDETLKSLVGVDFFPFIVWTEDPETTDIYSDSVADMVRTPNKVINVWYSQMVENRTLKNFQMHWFAPVQGYTAQTYTPGPGAMLPSPPLGQGQGINDVIKPVDISGLDDTIGAIEALTRIIERGTGATAIDKGEGQTGTQTLGEIEILVGKSTERTIGMAKFYRLSWYETASKWAKLMHENAPKVLKLYKVGRSGKVYTKKVMASDWKSKEGYEPIVASSSEHEQESIKTIQKFQFALGMFPDNMALREIAQKRTLEALDLTPDELKQIEEGNNPQPQLSPMQPQQEQPVAQGQPVDPEQDSLMNDINSSLTELNG